MEKTRRFYINKDMGYMTASEIQFVYGVHKATVNRRYNRGLRGENLIKDSRVEIEKLDKLNNKGFLVNPGVFSQWGRPDMQEVRQ